MASNVGAMELESGTATDAGLENDGAHGIGLEDEGLAQKVGGGGGAGAGALFWHGGSVNDARLNAVSTQPRPSENIVQCFIKRNKTTSTYQLFLGLPSTLVVNGKLLLAAQKFCQATNTHFIISMNLKDTSRGSTTYVGELRSYNVAHIAYELNVLGMPYPRRMQCTFHTLPASTMELGGSTPTLIEFTASTLELGFLSKDKPLVLKNKAPHWNEKLQSWCLNFLSSRVTMKSVKNFQLVVLAEAPPTTMQSDHDKVLLQFKKIGKDMFIMDYQYLLSAF